MKITDFLSKECIKLKLSETNKDGHLKEMVNILSSAGKVPASKVNQITSKLVERENMGSTGIGEGVAIPHVKTEHVGSIVGALGISEQGIEFDSLDGAPVYISFLLLTPVEARNEHLKALSEISLFLKDKYYRDELKAMKNEKQAYKLIKKL
ncbi:MAG: PTS sugar transporter subunit IIA [Elusimicrobia bacterium]|nr:PTS sugar transporter subunit IIA [Elusimicrobiota bacterium]